MQSSCFYFKHNNPYNERYKFGRKSKNIIISNIYSIYFNENIRLGDGANKR